VIGRQRRSSAGTKAQTRAYAQRSADLAAVLRAEIGAPERPHGLRALVLVMGVPGAGKSHCARLLARRLGAAHVSSDHLRSRMFVAPSYAPAENAALFAAADAVVDGLLAEGHRVVLDATHLRASDRAAPGATARRRGAPLVHVLVTAPEEEIRARLAQRRAGRAAGDHSDADERVYEAMRSRPFEPPDGPWLEVRNGPHLEVDMAHVVAEVERACAPAS
jgi:hypothetical protein